MDETGVTISGNKNVLAIKSKGFSRTGCSLFLKRPRDGVPQSVIFNRSANETDNCNLAIHVVLCYVHDASEPFAHNYSDDARRIVAQLV